MAQKADMAAFGQLAGLPDQAQGVPSFARALPDGPGEGSVSGKDNGKGDVASRCAQHNCICNCEQPNKVRALVVSGTDAWGHTRFPARGTHVARCCVQADSKQVILANNNAGRLAAGVVAQA